MAKAKVESVQIKGDGTIVSDPLEGRVGLQKSKDPEQRLHIP